MLKMIVSGCNGHMGQCVVCGCAELEGVEIVAGFNRTPVKKNCFEVYSEPMSYEGPADVVVDFSNPANLDGLLEFCLLYTPCVAAVASVKRELGGKWAAIMVAEQCLIAWVCALLVRFIALAIL